MAIMYECRQKVTKPYDAGTMTVRLNLNDSDPTTWGEYFDDAVGLTPGSDNFDTFFGHYPCILENGVELGTLRRNNFAYYTSGSSAPITTLGKDVMIAFPRRGLKIWKSGNYVFVSITTKPNLSGYEYYAFTYKGTPCDKVYIGAYLGYNENNIMYSTSGKTASRVNPTNSRTYPRNKGTGYEQFAFYQLVYLQAMYLIKYKGYNCRTAIGGNSSSNPTTGVGNSSGMDAAIPKLFGIERLWGTQQGIYVDGIYINSSSVLLSDGNYNSTGEGYYTAISSKPFSTGSYLHYVYGTSRLGFLPNVHADSNEANSKYFCGYAMYNNTDIMRVSGGSADPSLMTYLTKGSDNSNARLVYFKTREG